MLMFCRNSIMSVSSSLASRCPGRQVFVCFMMTLGLFFPSWTNVANASQIALFRNDISAYSCAIGGALTAQPGVYSQFYNPAATALRPRMTLESSMTTLYDVALKEGAFLVPTEWGVFSGALVYGSLDGLLYSELDANLRPVLTGGSFGYSATKVLLGWADSVVRLSPELNGLDPLRVGVQLDYEAESLEKASGSFVALNLGVLYELDEVFALGLAVNNLLKAQQVWHGGQAQAVEAIDTYVNTGLHYALIKDQLGINLDYPIGLDGAKLRLGLEYQLLPGVHLLAGSGDSPLQLGVRLGLGVLYFDCAYASAKHEYLSDAYRFSLGFALDPFIASTLTPPAQASPHELMDEYSRAGAARRLQILKQLTENHDQDFYTFLLEIIKNDLPGMKLAAMGALVSQYPDFAMNALMECLFDQNRNVKIQAAGYLAHLGHQQAAVVISQIIPFESDPGVRKAFEDALSSLKIKI